MALILVIKNLRSFAAKIFDMGKNKPTKKVAPKAKPAAKKAAAKPAPKKVVAAKAPAKKTTAKAPVKKVAAKPAAKKTAPKPAAKKVVAKAAPKKVVAKATPKKAVAKKSAPKPVAKKVAAKPAKPAAKKAVKPVAKKVAVKKAVPKAAPKPAVKKSVAKPAKPIAKKVVAKPVAAKAVVAKPAAKPAPVKPAAAAKPTPATAKQVIKKPVEQPVLKKEKVMTSTSKTPAKALENIDNTQVRYSDAELKEFKDLIEKKLESAREELKALKESLDNHNESLAGNKSWNMEEGSDTTEMEYLMNQISRQHQYLRNLESALVRIENKTYGICRATGKLIAKERLRLVPHATLSVEAKMSRKPEDQSSGLAHAPIAGSDDIPSFSSED